MKLLNNDCFVTVTVRVSFIFVTRIQYLVVKNKCPFIKNNLENLFVSFTIFMHIREFPGFDPKTLLRFNFETFSGRLGLHFLSGGSAG